MEQGVKNIKTLVILGLILYIILLQQCSEPCSKEIVKSDTTHVTHVDTIPFYDTIPRYISFDIPNPVLVYDTIFDTVKVFNEYTVVVNDSLIDGKIISKVDGVLVDQSFTYLPKFPKYILRTDSIFVNNTIEQRQTNKVYLGAEIGGNNQAFNISPKITLSTKKGWNYGFRYGVLDKTYNFSIEKKLSFK
jgi:hypothetical protein